MFGEIERIKLEVNAEEKVGDVVETPFAGVFKGRPTQKDSA